MTSQLRTYKVKRGSMTDFVTLWRDHIVPAREAHGFVVEGAWLNAGANVFVWVVHHDDFEEAERAYYASDARATLPADPADFLDDVDLQWLDPL